MNSFVLNYIVSIRFVSICMWLFFSLHPNICHRNTWWWRGQAREEKRRKQREPFLRRLIHLLPKLVLCLLLVSSFTKYLYQTMLLYFVRGIRESNYRRMNEWLKWISSLVLHTYCLCHSCAHHLTVGGILQLKHTTAHTDTLKGRMPI